MRRSGRGARARSDGASLTVPHISDILVTGAHLVYIERGRQAAPHPVIGMEGDRITMRDIFVFEKTGVTDQGRVTGRFRATGIRRKFYDRLKMCGIVMPASLFQTVVEIG